MPLLRCIAFLSVLVISPLPLLFAQDACRLRVTSTPDSAEVFVDGRSMGTTPVVCADLAIGTHFLELRKAGFLPFRDTLRFETRTLFMRDIQLREPATLAVRSDPPGARLEINGSPAGETPAIVPGLASGVLQLRLVKPGYDAWERNIVVQSAETTDVTIQLKGGMGTLSVDVFPPRAEVRMDSTIIGTGGVTGLRFPSGKYLLLVRDPETGEDIRGSVFLPAGSRVHLRAEIGAFSTDALVASALVPGFGQLNDGATVKGIAIMAGFAGCIAATVISQARFLDRQETYEGELDAYNGTTTETGAVAARTSVESAFSRMRDSHRTRNLIFAGLAGVYVVNLIDALLFHSRSSGLTVVPDEISRAASGPSIGLAVDGREPGFVFSVQIPLAR